jgi:hypothetical protein
LESQNDKPFVWSESRLDKLSNHVQHASQNFVDWYIFSWKVEPTLCPRKTVGPFFIKLAGFYQTGTGDEKTWSMFITQVCFY